MTDNLPGTVTPQPDPKGFEQLKLVNPHGAEYWSARDLQILLGYSQWRRFEEAVTRAITSCTQSGNDPAHHFAGAGKMITLGKGQNRQRGRIKGVDQGSGLRGDCAKHPFLVSPRLHVSVSPCRPQFCCFP